VMENMQIFSQ